MQNHNEKLIVLVALTAMSGNANAYLDPGTGSILVQGVIAGIAAIAYTVKIYWYRIKAFCTGKPYVPLDLSIDDSGAETPDEK